MLLFVKKRFADALRDGTKTLEIRAGQRYLRITVGRVLSINGRDRMRVVGVEHYETRAELLEALRGRHAAVGCASPVELREALRACYPVEAGPYVVLSVEPEEKAARA